MATLEELTVEATAEIEAAKPMYKQVNNERLEFTEADYEQAITDLANSKFDEQQYGYIEKRVEAYGALSEQMDMQFKDATNGTTTWVDHVAKVKADFPKPE